MTDIETAAPTTTQPTTMPADLLPRPRRRGRREGDDSEALPPIEPRHWGLQKFQDPLRIPPRIQLDRRPGDQEITVTARSAWVQLHSQLPPTPVWGYDGHAPGPTIEVRRDQLVRINWLNQVTTTAPLTGVRAVAPGAPQAGAAMTVPGWRDGGTPRPEHHRDDRLDALRAWTVVHLHGSLTNGWNDGWTNNAVQRGGINHTEYPNRQRAATLWYHDHAMDITRFNVHTGLAGLYFIRDEEEDDLELPSGEHELPLILRDVNLDTDENDRLTGHILYKVGRLAPGTESPYDPDELPGVDLPVNGPFTMVNHVIWPHVEVEARWYRLRLLNSANARFYRLHLVDDHDRARVLDEHVRVIGTDGGLLGEPAELPEDGLEIAPGERYDVLVDFGALRGRRVVLTDANTASADPGTPPVTEPDVIQFRVDRRRCHDRFRLPQRLAASYERADHSTNIPADHGHFYVGIVPPDAGNGVHPELWELIEEDEPPAEPTEGHVSVKNPEGKILHFRRGAKMFHDTTNFFVDEGSWVVWNLLHISTAPPAHPIHIHMSEFQMLTRRVFTNPEVWDNTRRLTTAALEAPDDGPPIVGHQIGWKDTFVVEPGQWVTVAGDFSGATGNFMYHCHILDHEDMGMMRPFVVRPADVSPFDEHHASGHH